MHRHLAALAAWPPTDPPSRFGATFRSPSCHMVVMASVFSVNASPELLSRFSTIARCSKTAELAGKSFNPETGFARHYGAPLRINNPSRLAGLSELRARPATQEQLPPSVARRCAHDHAVASLLPLPISSSQSCFPRYQLRCNDPP